MEKLLIVLILVLSFCLRVYNLDSLDFWVDESGSIFIASQEDFSQFITMLLYTRQQPLYHLILRFWISLTNNSEFIIRFPNVLIGVAITYVSYKFAVKHLNNKWIGLITALLVALSVFHINYSQEARPYNLMCFLSIVSMYYFVQIIQDPSRLKKVFYVISSVLLLYTHSQGIFILLTQNIYLLTSLIIKDTSLKIKIKTWFSLMALILLLFVPWLYFLTRQVIRSHVLPSGWLDIPSLLDLNLLFTNYFSGSVFACVIYVVLAVIGILKLKNTKKNYLIALWIFMPIIIPYIFSKIFFPIFVPRYELLASIPFYILVSSGICSTNKYARIIIILIVSASLFFNINSYCKSYSNYSYRTAEWKDSINYVQSHITKSDLIFIYPYYFQYNFYIQQNNIPVIGLNLPLSKEMLDMTKKRIWLIHRSCDSISSEDFFKDYKLVIHKKFKGVTIKVFEKLLRQTKP